MTVDSHATPSAPAVEAGEERAYLYGIVAADSDLTELVGLDGRSPLQLIPAGPVAAVYSAIPGEFDSPDQLNERDLAALVGRHDEVLRSIAARTTVLPVRFGAATTQPDRLATALRPSADQLAGQLSAVAGCSEWGLQVEIADRPEARSASSTARPASGTDYLRSRKEQRDGAATSRRELTDFVARVETALDGAGALAVVDLATDAKRVFNRSYLVPDSQSAAFLDTAARYEDELARLGGALRVTGPWIAYSFTAISLGGEPDD